MSEQRLSSSEFAEELLVRTAGQIIADELDEEIDHLLATTSVELPSEEIMRSLGDQIRNEEQNAQRFRHLSILAHKASRYVACLAITLLIAGTLSFSISASARGTLATLILKNFGTYSQTYTESSAPLSKPLGWDYQYYPTTLPVDYQFDRIEFANTLGTIYYQSQSGRFISFTCFNETIPGYNSENRIAEEILVGVTPAYLFLGEDEASKVLIIHADSTIVITSTMSYTELITFANGIYGLP